MAYRSKRLSFGLLGESHCAFFPFPNLLADFVFPVSPQKRKVVMRVLNWLSWMFIVIAMALIVVSFWIPPSVFDPLKTALPVGILIALATHLVTQARAAQDSTEKRSQFYLESCVLAYEEARNLLLDGNNDRVTWIAAGRALAHAKQLSLKVTVDAHLRVLELHKLKYRRFFHEALADKSASFFYGCRDTSVTLDEAARLSSAGEKRGGRDVTSTVKELSEKSLYAVWEAAQWPHAYQDPLDKGFSKEQKDKLLVLWPGLHEYLEHKEQWHSASGKLFKRKNDENH